MSETSIPEELEAVWDDKVAAEFAALRPKQQDFLLHYLRTGNAAEAYRRAYNNAVGDHQASSQGAQAMASKGIEAILTLFQEQKTHDLFLCINTLREMAQATKPEWVEDKDGQWQNVGDAPDWGARKDAVVNLAKLRGLNAAEEKKITGSLVVQSAPLDEAL